MCFAGYTSYTWSFLKSSMPYTWQRIDCPSFLCAGECGTECANKKHKDSKTHCIRRKKINCEVLTKVLLQKEKKTDSRTQWNMKEMENKWWRKWGWRGERNGYIMSQWREQLRMLRDRWRVFGECRVCLLLYLHTMCTSPCVCVFVCVSLISELSFNIFARLTMNRYLLDPIVTSHCRLCHLALFILSHIPSLFFFLSHDPLWLTGRSSSAPVHRDCPEGADQTMPFLWRLREPSVLSGDNVKCPGTVRCQVLIFWSGMPLLITYIQYPDF